MGHTHPTLLAVLLLGTVAAATASARDLGDRVDHRLDQRGDRIEAGLDRRGDRADRRWDRRGDRFERRWDRRG